MILTLVAICVAQDAGNQGGGPAPEAKEVSGEPVEAAPAAPAEATSVAPAAGASPAASAASPADPAAPPADPAPAPDPATPAGETTADAPDGAPDPAAADPLAAARAARIAELSLVRIPTDTGYELRDGRGRVVDARTLAILTGDAELLGRIAAQRRKGRTLGWGLVAAGAGVAATSSLPLAFLEDALAENEGTDAFNEIGVRNDAKVATAFSLLGAGVILAGTGFASHAAADRRAADVTAYLDAAAADARIAAYEARLAEALATRAPTEDSGSDLPESEVPDLP
jgi:hypothetical protein